jgi:hypothetical protein
MTSKEALDVLVNEARRLGEWGRKETDEATEVIGPALEGQSGVSQVGLEEALEMLVGCAGWADQSTKDFQEIDEAERVIQKHLGLKTAVERFWA